MESSESVAHRPSVDIRADIEKQIALYPPLAHDRHSIHIQVDEGVVKLSGYVQTPISRRYLLDALRDVPGVEDVNADELYDDETLRREVAKVLPSGVIVARCQYGSVVLSGQLPPGVTAAAVAHQARQVPGIRRVFVLFGA